MVTALYGYDVAITKRALTGITRTYSSKINHEGVKPPLCCSQQCPFSLYKGHSAIHLLQSCFHSLRS